MCFGETTRGHTADVSVLPVQSASTLLERSCAYLDIVTTGCYAYRATASVIGHKKQSWETFARGAVEKESVDRQDRARSFASLNRAEINSRRAN